MSDREIRDSNNFIIGWCRDVGDRITATHIQLGYVGCYVKNSNLTLDGSGRIYCHDDGTPSLIRDAEREYKNK